MNVMTKGFGLPGLNRLMASVEDGGRSVLVGVPAGVEHVDETRLAQGPRWPEIAAIHEFGYPEGNIPERPVLRQGVSNGAPRFRRLNVASARQIMRGEMTVDQAVERLGVVAVGEVKREFTRPSPAFKPNAPATVAAKGSSRPLIDSGQYRQSITYQLEGKLSDNAKVLD